MEELMVAPKNAVETVTFISEVMVAVLLLNSCNVPVFQLQVQRQALVRFFDSHCPPGTHLIPIHQRMNMVQ